MNGYGCVLIQLLFTKTYSGQIWHTGHSLLTSVLDHLSTRPWILLEYEVLGMNTLLCPQGMAGPWGMSVGWGGLQKSLPSIDFREAQA